MDLGGKKCFQYKWKTEDTFIFSIDKVTFWGITIDKLTFKAHIENLYKKASRKLYILQRIRKIFTATQAKAITSPFVNSQLNYCVIMWMFCSRKSKLRWENINKWTLTVVLNKYDKN